MFTYFDIRITLVNKTLNTHLGDQLDQQQEGQWAAPLNQQQHLKVRDWVPIFIIFAKEESKQTL